MECFAWVRSHAVFSGIIQEKAWSRFGKWIVHSFASCAQYQLSVVCAWAVPDYSDGDGRFYRAGMGILLLFCGIVVLSVVLWLSTYVFLPTAVVVFMLLFAIAGAQWRTTFTDCSAACVAKASKVCAPLIFSITNGKEFNTRLVVGKNVSKDR